MFSCGYRVVLFLLKLKDPHHGSPILVVHAPDRSIDTPLNDKVQESIVFNDFIHLVVSYIS